MHPNKTLCYTIQTSFIEIVLTHDSIFLKFKVKYYGYYPLELIFGRAVVNGNNMISKGIITNTTNEPFITRNV